VARLDLDDGKLADGRPGPVGEAVCPYGLLQSGNALGGEVHEQRAEIAAFQQDIVRGEGKADLVLAAFGVEELAPWQHIGALQENDFQSGWAFMGACLPSFLTIG